MCNSCTSCLGLAEQTARQMSSREDLLWWDAPHVGGSPVWLCLGQHGRLDGGSLNQTNGSSCVPCVGDWPDSALMAR